MRSAMYAPLRTAPLSANAEAETAETALQSFHVSARTCMLIPSKLGGNFLLSSSVHGVKSRAVYTGTMCSFDHTS